MNAEIIMPQHAGRYLAQRQADRAQVDAVSMYLAKIGGRSMSPERARADVARKLDRAAWTIGNMRRGIVGDAPQRGDLGDPGRRARAFDWSALTPEVAAALPQALAAEGLALRSRAAVLSCLRGLTKRLARRGDVAPQDLTAILEDARETVATDSAKVRGGRALDLVEVAKLYQAAEADQLRARGLRDAALLGVLISGAVRRAEAAALTVTAVDLATHAVQVTGKGNKQRIVYISGRAAVALGAWMTVRGDAPGAVFVAIDKAGHVRGASLTATSIGRILDSLALRAGVSAFTAHDLRRTWATHALDAGVPLQNVQDQLGHASPTTTRIYDRSGDRARAAAIAGLERLPF